MAAQHSTVTIDSVTFKLVMEWAVRGLRSQHLVNRYSSSPNSEIIKSAAGAEPNIPKLCSHSDKQRGIGRNREECAEKAINNLVRNSN